MENRKVKTSCLKCGQVLTLDLESASYQEALSWIEKVDRTPMECPGFHVEVGGWRKHWQLDRAIKEAYRPEERKSVLLIKSRFAITIGKSYFQFLDLNAVREFLLGYADGLRQQNRSLITLVKVERFNLVGELLTSFEKPLEELVSPSLEVISM
jgi:hypothetical protein